MGEQFFGDPISTCTEDLHRNFLDALEFLNPVIENLTPEIMNPFRTLIPTGTFALGEGLVKESKRFHGGVGDLAGLTTWSQVQKGRAPGTLGQDDPGYDPCKYDAYMIRHGYDTVGYTIYQTARRSQDICVNDIKWNWEFSQQIALMFSYLANVTLNVKENFNQEQYITFCQKVVWTNEAEGVAFTYDPMTSTELKIKTGTQISTLSAKHFRYWYEKMLMGARSGALGVSGDMPVFPFVMNPLDFEDMLANDSTIREDFRYAEPQALVEGYGNIKRWRGTGFMNHPTQPRFRLNRIEGDDMIFERVTPMIEVAAGLQGTKWIDNPEYIKAEYALGMYFLKDVFTTLIPLAGPPSPGGGTSFETMPSWGGDWKWLVFKDRCENPLGEKGFYFSRFQMAPKPGKYYDKPVAVFYKRCPQVCLKVCEPCVDAAAGARTVVADSVEAVFNDGEEGAATYTRVLLTLNAPLSGRAAPDAVTVTNGAGDVTAYISKDANAPTYELTFTSAAAWVDTGITTVTP